MKSLQQIQAIDNLASLCWLARLDNRELIALMKKIPLWMRYDGWQQDFSMNLIMMTTRQTKGIKAGGEEWDRRKDHA